MSPEVSSQPRSGLTTAFVLTLLIATAGIGVAAASADRTASAAGTTVQSDEPIGTGNYTLSGRILLSNGEPAVNHTVLVTDRSIPRTGIDNELDTRTNESGYFAIGNLTTGHVYTIAYYSSSRRDIAAEFPTDDSPDMYAYGNVTLRNDTSVGTIRLPEASTVRVRVRNESGQPLKGVYVLYAHHNNGTATYWADVTEANGYVKDGAGNPEFELAGNVTLRADVTHEGHVKKSYRRDLTVTGNRNITIVAQENGTTPTPDAGGGDTTPTSDGNGNDGGSGDGQNGGGDGNAQNGGDSPGLGAVVAVVAVVLVLVGSFVLLRG